MDQLSRIGEAVARAEAWLVSMALPDRGAGVFSSLELPRPLGLPRHPPSGEL